MWQINGFFSGGVIFIPKISVPKKHEAMAAVKNVLLPLFGSPENTQKD
jgi:hypothetical protein